MTVITIADQVKCVERELAMRKNVYPKWVAAGKMREETANMEISRMEAVLRTLKTYHRGQQS